MYVFSRLVTGGVPPGHFSHVFVDEAGHAVETEPIISLAGERGMDEGGGGLMLIG